MIMSVLAAPIRGLKRLALVEKVSVLAALSMGLKRLALVVIMLALATLPNGLKRPALVVMVLIDPSREEVRPGPEVSVWAALQLGVVSPTRRQASPGLSLSAGQAAKLRLWMDTPLARRGRVSSKHKEEAVIHLGKGAT
jgi:hypothetical protein